MTPDLAKETSGEFLRHHAIEVNESLPTIEAFEDLRPQSARSIAIRSIVLGYVLGVGLGADTRRLKGALLDYELFEHASENERHLLSRTTHTPQEKLNASWLAECIQSLAWCLGLVELDPFRRCDDDLANQLPKPFTDPRGFLSDVSMRSHEEIYQQVDLHYRLHWAARNARLRRRMSRVDEGIISERRKALEWAIGAQPNWDGIRLDT
jgi:hypothetical protein